MILRIGNKQRLGYSEKRIEKKRNLSAKRYALNAKSGLTLIEVLLAVSILGIGITGVLQAYASSIATLEMGQFTIDGSSLVKQKMAEVEQAIMEEEAVPTTGESGGFETPYEDFMWEWSIAPSETESLYSLSLVVSHQYNPRTFTLKTYVVEREKEE